jgi:probable phosphoglycerate mutase
LLRTQRTAALIAETMGGLSIETEALFLERRLGEWNGMSVADTEPLIKARQTPPGGESEEAFRARIEAAVEALRPNLPCCPLVVSSKGVARMLNLMLGDPSRAPAGNAEVIEFRL